MWPGMGGGFGMGGYPGPWGGGGMWPGMGGGFGMGGFPGPWGGGGMWPGMGGGFTGMMGTQMQMQLEQMQIYMRQQQQAQQSYMARYKTIGRLQQELWRIQMQIQQVATGGYGGTHYPGTLMPRREEVFPPRTGTIPRTNSRGRNIR